MVGYQIRTFLELWIYIEKKNLSMYVFNSQMRNNNRSPVTPLKASLSSVCHPQPDSANHTHKQHFLSKLSIYRWGAGCTHTDRHRKRDHNITI